VVADIRPLVEFSGPIEVQDTVLYVRAEEDVGDDLALTVSGQATSARFTSRYETLIAVTEAPMVAAVDRGLVVTFGLSTLFAVVAAISSLALSSAARRRDFGYLRTLGLKTQQATGLTMLEQLPMLVVACGVGSLLGVGIVFVLQPSINLDAFTGGLISATVQFDWLAVAAVSAILMISLAAAVVIFVLVNRNKDLGRILKVGGE
jgi:ABC-type antimicrobial peptide transport system permease subunit